MFRKIVAVWVSLAMLLGFVVIVDVVTDITPRVKAATITVDDSGGAMYTKIQDAINASNDGDTVFVYNGTYYENVVVNKTINLTGEDSGNTIIDGGGSGDVVWVEADLVNITGFNITNSGGGSGDAGIELNNVGNCLVLDNKVQLNGLYGIYLYFSNGNNITNNNVSSNLGVAICLVLSMENDIINNTVLNNVGEGILLVNCNNNYIVGNNASNNDAGFYSRDSQWNYFIGNNASNNQYGIRLQGAMAHTVSDNILFNNSYDILHESSSGSSIFGNIMKGGGIIILGGLVSYWDTHNIDTSNEVNGKPVVYWKNINGGSILSVSGQIILADCKDILIENHNFTNVAYGIQLGFSSFNQIIGNTVSNSDDGIRIYRSDGNNITGNNVSSSDTGISVSRSNNNDITGNNISNNNFGIQIWTSSENNITANKASFNLFDGIFLYSSSKNNITDNILSSNNRDGIFPRESDWNSMTNNNISSNQYGIYIEDSSNNQIYHNNFTSNNFQAYDNGANSWDDGYPSGGNYWSDYGGVDNLKGPNQDIPGSDGIGDTPYWKDNYPLMESYKPLENYATLKQGWNLISIPLIQEEQNLTRVLGSIDSLYDAVQWHDITDADDPWKHHKVDKPLGNDLFHLNETMGFWIHVNQPGDTIFLYNGTKPTSNQSITLHQGWNMVGYPSLSNRNRTATLNNLNFGTDVDAIWTYNAATQTWQEIGPSDYFELGRGYWIHSKVTKVWDVPL